MDVGRLVGGAQRLVRDGGGQMSVELALILPVALVVAVVAVNAMVFFSECAAFDRVGRSAVRICATSPAYEQGLDQSIAQVEALIVQSLEVSEGDVEVSGYRSEWGHTTFEMTLTYRPTLFGLGMRDEVLGVALPSLTHTEKITVDCYKPGMVV